MSIVYELLVKEEQSLLKKLEEVRLEMKKYSSTSYSVINELAHSVSQPISNPKPTVSAEELKKSSNPQKILIALKENERFMRIREIAEYICHITKEDVDGLVIQLSRRTKYLKEKGAITKVQIGKSKKNTFWGSPKWIDSNGSIKDGYEYNSDSIDENQTVLIDL